MKKLICTITLAIFILVSKAQEKKSIFGINQTSVYYIQGVSLPDFNNLNKALVDSGYAPFKAINFTNGFGFNAYAKKMIYSFSFVKIMQCVENTHETCSHLNFNSISLLLGYSIYKKEKINLYPFISVSHQKTEFLIANNDIPSNDFMNYYLNVANISQVTNTNWSSAFGLSFDSFIGLGKKISSHILIGGKIAYSLNINNGTWYEHEDEVKLNSVPKINIMGINGQLNIGLKF